MLTGSGVALILRVPDTPPDDHWSTHAWYVFAGVAAFSLATKYLIRYRGSHVFNPSNVGLVVAFLVLGSTRVEPLDFWWAPLDAGMLLAYAVILVGGLLITARLGLLATAATFWLTPRGGASGVLAASGSLHGRPLGVRAGLRLRLLAGDHHLARGPDLPVLHDHGPEDRADRARRPGRVRRPRRRGQHPAHGAPDGRVRDQGRAPRRAGRRLRVPSAPRPAAARHARATEDDAARSRRPPAVAPASPCPVSSSGRGVACSPVVGLVGAAIVAAGVAGPRRVVADGRRRAGPGAPRRRPGHLPLDHRRTGRARLEPRDHRERGRRRSS